MSKVPQSLGTHTLHVIYGCGPSLFGVCRLPGNRHGQRTRGSWSGRDLPRDREPSSRSRRGSRWPSVRPLCPWRHREGRTIETVPDSLAGALVVVESWTQKHYLVINWYRKFPWASVEESVTLKEGTPKRVDRNRTQYRLSTASGTSRKVFWSLLIWTPRKALFTEFPGSPQSTSVPSLL